MSSLPPPALPLPIAIGRYDAVAKIADGGMATLYVGRPRDVPGKGPGDIVALKMIRPEFVHDRNFVDMFLDEAKIISRFRHPNIVLLHELGVDGSRIFIVMELLHGQSLWEVWQACRERSVRLRYDMLAWMGARIAEALHYAHEIKDVDGRAMEIVHRDVNATNIFVTYDGQVKVIDFGLAKAANRLSKTAVGVIKGKVAYMSPEQAIGAPVDRRTDIFALATTLWELSVDRRLFKRSDDIETLKSVHAALVPKATTLVEGYPAQLERILARALAKKREDRYPTALEFARELDEFAGGASRTTGPAGLAEVMRELFAVERTRQAAWFAEASLPQRRGPLHTLRPGSTFHNLEVAEEGPAPKNFSRTATVSVAAQASFEPAPVAPVAVGRPSVRPSRNPPPEAVKQGMSETASRVMWVGLALLLALTTGALGFVLARQ